MSDVKPTGRWRHRVWKGRLVLQIEEGGTYTDCIGGFVGTEHVTRWRDALPEDVTVAQVAHPPCPPGAAQ